MDNLTSRILGWNRDKLFAKIISNNKISDVTYDDLISRASKYTSYLDKNGVEPGDIVIIVLKHGVDLYASFLGALLGGFIPSILPFPSSKQDPDIYWPAQKKLFDRISAKAFITYDENIDACNNYGIGKDVLICSSNGIETLNSNQKFAGSNINPASIAFLQHSSGTTGLKKGVSLSHRAVLQQLDSYASILGVSEVDRIATWLPLYHDMGLIACFLLPMVHGIPIVALDTFEWVVRPKSLLRAISEYECTFCWLPNFAFSHIAKSPEKNQNIDLHSMRAFINCSEPCTPAAFDTFYDAFKDFGLKREMLQCCYAMAETVFAATQTKLSTEVISSNINEGKYLSSGQSIPGVEIRIVGEDSNVVGNSSLGEIEIKADFLFEGYFKNDEESSRKLVNGWYKTGDLGFLENGELYVIGRWDDIIIYHGKKYSALELESCISSAVAEIKPGRLAVINTGVGELIALYEPISDVTVDPDYVSSSIRKSLQTRYDIVLSKIECVPQGWLVKSSSGKLARAKNVEKYQNIN